METPMIFETWLGLGRVLIVGTLPCVCLVVLLRVSGKRTRQGEADPQDVTAVVFETDGSFSVITGSPDEHATSTLVNVEQVERQVRSNSDLTN